MTADTLPRGTVTFVFTDIEGSTRLLERVGGDAFVTLIEQHNDILRSQVEVHDGVLIRTEGDAVFAVFRGASDAVVACAEAQRRLAGATWPGDEAVRVRIGIHTGSGMPGGGDYVGIDVHRAARIAAAANGGQTVLSEPTAVLVERTLPDGCALRDLGKHRLKDLSEAETLFQLDVPGLPWQFPALRTLNAIPNNLPMQLTSFVGREEDVATAVRLVRSSRLLTLTGPGGTGKTRLSMQVAAEVAEEFPDGVFFVSLSPVTDPELVPTAILNSMGLTASGVGQSPHERLLAQIADRRVLLVLDNYEHLLEAAPLVAELVRISPGSRFVVTSRAPLHISGEQEMPVSPLPVLGAGWHGVDEVARSEAVQLFLERAMAVRPDFTLSDDNSRDVAELVARLDGLPLAIELVASRVKLLSAGAILQRFDARTFSHGTVDLPERQQTLWNAIAWSHDLLDEPLRRLFARFSVFRGGARLEEIEAVCGPAGDLGVDVIEGLSGLVDHSLIVRADRLGEVRFRMLHVIREFAQEQLAASGETEDIGRRHAEVYVAFAEEAAPHVFRADRKHWFDRMEADHDNMRGAMEWAESHGETDLALRLAWAAWRFWQARGYLHEARRRVDAALAMEGGSEALRAKALEACGGIAWWQGDMDICFRVYDMALEMQRRLGNRREIANALYNYGLALGFGLNKRAEAMEILDEAEAIYEELGDVGGLADVSWGKGNTAVMIEDDGETGRHYLQRALDLYQQAGNEFGLGWALFEYGESARRSGLFEEARDHLFRGLELFHSQDDVSGEVFFLAAIAGLTKDTGDMSRAVRLAGAAQALRIESGADLLNFEVNLIEGLTFDQLESLTGELGAAYREGKAMTRDEAVAYALER